MGVEVAMMLAMVVLSLVFQVVKKKKMKGMDDNPEVGYRYWGDAMHACAYYSDRTASMWCSRVFRQGEEFNAHTHMPYASYFGERYNIGAHGTDTHVTTAFTVPFDAIFTDWENDDILYRTNRAPKYTRAGGGNPQYPAHYPGVAMVYTNQGYMGLNAATLSTYMSVWNTIPGTVYYLLQLGGAYGNSNLWVRWRKTIDLSWTIGINPVCIVADLLLDQKFKDDIDWESFAYAGKKLVEESPYMWFSMALGQQSQETVIQDVLSKARLALRTLPNGKIGLKLIGELPANGPLSFPIIDALNDLSDFTISKASIDAADVINEVRGTYLAARFDVEQDFAKYVLPADKYEEYLQWERDNAGSLIGKPLDEKLRLFPGMSQSAKDYLAASSKTAETQQFEGHMLEADAHAINVGNIILTGIRKQQTQDVSFLSWPDDARAYLGDVIARADKPYIMGTATGGMKLSNTGVGDCLRIVVRDMDIGVAMDRVFEVIETTISGFPSEEVTLELKENHAWYDLLNPMGNYDGEGPNNGGGGDWDTGLDPTPVPTGLFSVEMFALSCSQYLIGVPVLATSVSKACASMEAARTYAVQSCSADAALMDDAEDTLTTEQQDFPLNCELLEPLTIPQHAPGLVYTDEIVARVVIPECGDVANILPEVQKLCISFAGSASQLFSPELGSVNYALFSAATLASPSGAAVLCRVLSMQHYVSGEDIFVRMQGVYVCDVPTTLEIPAGGIVAILPQSNTYSSYEFSAAPLPAFYARAAAQLSTGDFHIRTVIADITKATEWKFSYCGKYSADDRWLKTPMPRVYGVNQSELCQPSKDAVFVSSGTDKITFWLDVMDITRIKSDKSNMGLPNVQRGAFDSTTTTGTMPIDLDDNSAETAVKNLNVTLYVRNAGGSVVSQKAFVLAKTRPTVTLQSLGLTYTPGVVYSTEFTISYVCDTDLLDGTLELQPITVEGPKIYG